MKKDLDPESDSHPQQTSREAIVNKSIMTSIKWNMGNSVLGLAAVVLAVVALSRTVESSPIATTETSLVKYSAATDVIEYDHELHARGPWFVIGLIFSVANFGFSLYGLASACKDFSENTGNKFSCIYGAISTAITIAGAGWTGWNKYIEIGDQLINAGNNARDVEFLYKRDALIGDLTGSFSNNTGLTAEFVGHSKVSRVMTVGKEVQTTVSHVPTVRVWTPNNDSFHFAIQKKGETGFTSLLGMYGGTNTTTTKREDFNEENFSKGGLEFTHHYVANEDGDGGVLSQQNDWQTIYDQTSCKASKDIMNDHSRNYAQYQIYDHNNEGTIASGAIVPFENQPEGFHGIDEEPHSVPEDSDCAIN